MSLVSTCLSVLIIACLPVFITKGSPLLLLVWTEEPSTAVVLREKKGSSVLKDRLVLKTESIETSDLLGIVVATSVADGVKSMGLVYVCGERATKSAKEASMSTRACNIEVYQRVKDHQ